MKRLLVATLMVLGLMGSTWGCAGGSTAAFERTRSGKPHSFHNRIHHPQDYRCDRAGSVDS